MLGLFSPVEACTEVTSTPDEVWAVISDPETYPDWLVGAQKMRSVDADFPAPGSALHHSVGPSEGVTMDDVSEATEAHAPHLLGLRVHVGPLKADVELLVEPTASGSVIRFRERPAGLPFLLTPFVRPVLYARNLESLRRLSNHLDVARRH